VSWGGQVRAVFVKDLRQAWWMLAGLAALMTMTVVGLTVSQPSVGESFGWYDTFIPIVILALVVSIMRADPPGVSTAFWATQPLRPSAVAAAKLSYALLVTGMAMVGVTIVLRWWGLDWLAVPRTLAVTAIGTITVATSAVMMVIIGSDRRAIVLSVLAVGATAYIVGMMTNVVTLPVDPNSAWPWCLFFAVQLWLAAWVYRSRELTLLHRVGSSVLLFMTFTSGMAVRQADPKPFVPNAPSAQARLRVQPVATQSGQFEVSLTDLRAVAEKMQFVDGTVRIERQDGTIIIRRLTGSGSSHGGISRDRYSRHIDTTTWTLQATTPFRFRSEWADLYQPGARITVDGTVVESVMTEERRLPLASTQMPPRMFGERRVLQMVPRDTAMLALLTSRWFRIRESGPNELDSGLEVSLVPRGQRGTIRHRVNGHSSSSTGMSPMPGFWITDTRTELASSDSTLRYAADTTWWKDYEFVFEVPAMTRVYRVHAETVIPR
jgi:hypothetical protein